MDDYNARTIWCGNLSSEVTEDILYELFLQAGPLENVNIPKDVKSGRLRSYGFVTFRHQCSVPYAMELMNGETLFGRSILIQSRTAQGGVESPTYHGAMTSPQIPINYPNFNILGNGFLPSPYFVPRYGHGLVQHRPSELIVLDDDSSSQNQQLNRNQNPRHQNVTDDTCFIVNDKPGQNNSGQIAHQSNHGNNRHQQQPYQQSPAIRMDSAMRNPWEQFEDNSPNTSRQHHHHRQHRNWNPYENRRRY